MTEFTFVDASFEVLMDGLRRAARGHPLAEASQPGLLLGSFRPSLQGILGFYSKG